MFMWKMEKLMLGRIKIVKMKKILFLLTLVLSIISNSAYSQTKEIPIPRQIPEIPIFDGDRGYREILIIQDSTKELYRELQLFLSNKYSRTKDVIDLSFDVSNQSAGIIVAKGKFQIGTNSFNVMNKKYYKSITTYLVDHTITFEIKNNRVRATLNGFLVQEPPLDYTDIMGNVTRINYPKRSIQEMIEFTNLSFLDNSLNGRINIAKRYAFSDFLNSFHHRCEAYLDEIEAFLNQEKDNW